MKPRTVQQMINWFSRFGGYSEREIYAAYNEAIRINLTESLLATFSRHGYEVRSIFDITESLLELH